MLSQKSKFFTRFKATPYPVVVVVKNVYLFEWCHGNEPAHVFALLSDVSLQVSNLLLQYLSGLLFLSHTLLIHICTHWNRN